MKKILITGPESTGKTSLTLALAKHFNCPSVTEYARKYLEELDRDYIKNDLNAILEGQLKQEVDVINNGSCPYLFCDTGPEVIYIWSKVKYNHVDPKIEQIAQSHHYDFRFICYPDLKWEDDPLRESPNLDERLALFEKYCQFYENNNWPYVIVKGLNNDRIEIVLRAIL